MYATEKEFTNQVKNKVGVYILYSEKNINAGRSNNLSERIRNHLKEKGFWTNVVTLIRKDPMDPTMLALCEGDLIEKSQNLIGKTCLNKKGKDPAEVDSFQKSEAAEFIEDAMLLMGIVGIKIFEEKNATLRKRLESGTRKKSEAIEYLESNGTILGKHVYYCSNAKDNRLFAVDVHPEIADKETWNLIANDVTNRVLIVMNIPKGIMGGTNVRDDHDKYTLRFRASDFLHTKPVFPDRNT